MYTKILRFPIEQGYKYTPGSDSAGIQKYIRGSNRAGGRYILRVHLEKGVDILRVPIEQEVEIYSWFSTE